MLIKLETLLGIRAGEVDLAFRRWTTPRVREGTALRTALGLVEVASVEPTTLARITASDAHRAGFSTRRELLQLLRTRPGRLFRIELRFAGEDPRIALRKRSSLTDDEAQALRTRLERMDTRSREPWALLTLRLIRDRPGIRAADLASTLGSETRPFKARVRRLKELGLTESLEVGYRLSPRGRALLEDWSVLAPASSCGLSITISSSS